MMERINHEMTFGSPHCDLCCKKADVVDLGNIPIEGHADWGTWICLECLKKAVKMLEENHE